MIVELKEFLRVKIEEMFQALPSDDKLDVLIPDSIDNFKLSHPIGAVLITYKGSQFSDAKVNYNVSRLRDLTFTILLIARKSDRYPEEYIDLLIDKLSGIETTAKRADRQVKVIADEFVDETSGVWTYAIDIVAPMEVFQ